MTLTGRRRPLFDIVGEVPTVQIMMCSQLSNNFTIFWPTTTWHHRVSIQVANKSIYNFVGLIETVGRSPTLNCLSRGVFESNASNILTCCFVQGERGWAKFKPNFPSTASCRFLFRQPFCSFSSVAFFLSLSHQVITIPIQSQSYVRE